jgi:hypothetical protein
MPPVHKRLHIHLDTTMTWESVRESDWVFPATTTSSSRVSTLMERVWVSLAWARARVPRAMVPMRASFLIMFFIFVTSCGFGVSQPLRFRG